MKKKHSECESGSPSTRSSCKRGCGHQDSITHAASQLDAQLYSTIQSRVVQEMPRTNPPGRPKRSGADTIWIGHTPPHASSLLPRGSEPSLLTSTWGRTDLCDAYLLGALIDVPTAVECGNHSKWRIPEPPPMWKLLHGGHNNPTLSGATGWTIGASCLGV